MPFQIWKSLFNFALDIPCRPSTNLIMVAVNSTMLPLGTKAPDFRLPDTTGKAVSVSDFKAARAMLVVFICNHCPYVKHLRAGLAQLAKDYAPKGIALAGISSNDVE